MGIDNRQKLILNTIIREHIKTGAPVGSGVLVDKYNLSISPATVRHEMAELEEEGFIMQPYTSAGRVPTEKAYSLYLNSLKGKKLSNPDLKIFEKLLSDRNENSFKQTAKEMARVSGNTIFWATDKRHLFYAGIANLLQQPEFTESDLMRDIAPVIDRLDEIIDDIFDEIAIEYDTCILIGSNNPFSDSCSTILVKYKTNNKEGMFGILGPMRMDYERNLALINFIHNKLEEK